MKKIQIKPNSNISLIYLNSKFYSKESIISTLKEFIDFIDGKVLKLGNYFVLEMKNKQKEYSINEISNEFLNYLIGIEFQNHNKNQS